MADHFDVVSVGIEDERAVPLDGGGFRLPSVMELLTLVVKESSPSIDSTKFPNTPKDLFWTSTAFQFGGAWDITFDRGGAMGGPLDEIAFVRCVR